MSTMSFGKFMRAAVVGASALLASSAWADGAQDFTLHNETGVEIYGVYVSPASTTDWEEDILGQDTLPSGDSTDVSFSRDEDAELWDLKVVDSEGEGLYWEDLNLMEISEITLHYKNGKGSATTR